MYNTAVFYRTVLDSVTEHIVVIDRTGAIRFANAAWIDFGIANGCTVSRSWDGINYLNVCGTSAERGEAHATTVARGLRSVIDGNEEVFYHEYPCHSPVEKRWFMMRVTPLRWNGELSFVVSHQNITERVLAEERIKDLALTDDLSGIANRRHFDLFLQEEWRRAMRAGTPVSLIMLDIDKFKQFNDHYGHPAGDACLASVGKVLKPFGRRSGDLAARYGGEEFALILGGASLEAAMGIAGNVLDAIRGLKIPHEASTIEPTVTASLGVATAVPRKSQPKKVLVAAADQALYTAKDQGRNRIVAFDGILPPMQG